MTDVKLYKEAIEFLTSFSNVDEEMLFNHLESGYSKPKDLKIIYRMICQSAQNKQMSSKVIGGSINGVINLGKVLFDFDPVKVSKTYNKTDKEKLLDQIITTLKPNGQIRKTSKSLWPQYCQSVIDAAHFLSSFKDVDDFYNWTDFFAEDFRAKPALPLMISYEISGIGFPLACDFLKELGFSEYGKPDVHLKDIFKALGLIDQNEKFCYEIELSDFESIRSNCFSQQYNSIFC